MVCPRVHPHAQQGHHTVKTQSQYGPSPVPNPNTSVRTHFKHNGLIPVQLRSQTPTALCYHLIISLAKIQKLVSGQARFSISLDPAWSCSHCPYFPGILEQYRISHFYCLSPLPALSLTQRDKHLSNLSNLFGESTPPFSFEFSSI